MQTTNRLRSNRPRKKYDFYETPYELCEAALSKLRVDEIWDSSRHTIVGVDAGAGRGVWGQALKKQFFATTSYGIDINPMPEGIYQEKFQGDFINDKFLLVGTDLVYGNPPYSFAEEFVRKGWEVVEEGGYIYFLLRLAFLESKKRHMGLFTEMPPKRVYVLSRRPSFFTTKDGSKTVDALAYAMFLWQKGWEGKTELDWLYWQYQE